MLIIEGELLSGSRMETLKNWVKLDKQGREKVRVLMVGAKKMGKGLKWAGGRENREHIL